MLVPDSAAATNDRNVPDSVPVKELLSGSTVLTLFSSAENVTVFAFPFVNENEGLRGSEILIIPLPKDSTAFNIPSLSLSRSRLSTIPSLSKSVGQILMGISLDL